MTTLVTGATSGLGRNAIDALVAVGAPVRATGRNAAVGASLVAQGVPFLAADLSTLDAAQARALLAGVDTVWHCAALSSPWGRLADFTAANVVATSRLARFAVAHGVRRFVHVSTPSLYFDFRHRLNVTEEQVAAQPCNHYVRTKWVAEGVIRDMARAHPKTGFVILRPKALFGPHDRVLLPRILQVIESRGGALPLPRGGDARLDLTFAPNVVHAMQLASAAEGLPAARAFNITNQQPMRLNDVLTHLLCDELKRNVRIRRMPHALLDLVARGLEAASSFTQREPWMTRYSVGALHYDMTLSNARAQRELGYTPLHDMADGIRRTADWLRGPHGAHHSV